MSGNAIASVDGAAFANVPLLESLDLRSLDLVELPRNVFHNLSQLAILQIDTPPKCTNVVKQKSCVSSRTKSGVNFTAISTTYALRPLLIPYLFSNAAIII